MELGPVLLAEWTDLEAHRRYRETEQFAQWRTAITPYAAGPVTRRIEAAAKATG